MLKLTASPRTVRVRTLNPLLRIFFLSFLSALGQLSCSGTEAWMSNSQGLFSGWTNVVSTHPWAISLWIPICSDKAPPTLLWPDSLAAVHSSRALHTTEQSFPPIIMSQRTHGLDHLKDRLRPHTKALRPLSKDRLKNSTGQLPPGSLFSGLPGVRFIILNLVI